MKKSYITVDIFSVLLVDIFFVLFICLFISIGMLLFTIVEENQIEEEQRRLAISELERITQLTLESPIKRYDRIVLRKSWWGEVKPGLPISNFERQYKVRVRDVVVESPRSLTFSTVRDTILRTEERSFMWYEINEYYINNILFFIQHQTHNKIIYKCDLGIIVEIKYKERPVWYGL